MKKLCALSIVLLLADFGAAAHASTVSDQYGTTYTLNYSTVGTPAGDSYVFLTVNTSNYSDPYSGAGASATDYIKSVSVALDPQLGVNQQPTITLLSESMGWDPTLDVKDGGSGQSASGCSSANGVFVCDSYLNNNAGASVGSGDIYNFEFLVDGPINLGGAPSDQVQAEYNYLNGAKVVSTGDHGVGDLIATTPEPGSIALLGTALLGFAGIARKVRMSL